MPMSVGLDVLLDERPELVHGKRIGIVSNPNGVTRSLEGIVEALPRIGAQVVALFGPEHGIRGEAQAGAHVGTTADRSSGLPVYSLYGAAHRPVPETLAGLDALVYDMQDAGARFYTYLYTMAHCMEAARDAGLPIIVLDRPNPLNGVTVEGPVIEPELDSFVGAYGLPTRYGLTIGELARYFNTVGGIGCDLTVVPVSGWQREWWYDETGLPWILPSPNLPTVDSCLAFAGTCPLEGTNVSEGRGTTRPFEVLGAPWVDAPALARALNERGLLGVGFRACHFVPTFSKWQGEACHGVQLHVLDRSIFRPVRAGLEVLVALRRLWPEQFAWRNDGKSADRLLGDRAIRAGIDAGLSPEEIEAPWQPAQRRFAEVRESVLTGSLGAPDR
ncbi:MAG: exo-beta-N-acetylmuramidase NamZ family protein [Chloroflexota bacterium]